MGGSWVRVFLIAAGGVASLWSNMGGCAATGSSESETIALMEQGRRRAKADQLRHAGKHDQAIALYEKLLQEPSEGLNNDLALREGMGKAHWGRAGRLGGQEATAATLAADQKSALLYLRQALELAERHAAELEAEYFARLGHTLGTYLSGSGHPDEAIALYERMLRGRLSESGAGHVDTLYELGNAYFARSGRRGATPAIHATYSEDLDAAVGHQEAALAEASTMKGLDPELPGLIHNSLGLIGSSQMQPDRAIKHFTEAVTNLEEHGDPRRLADVLGNLIVELAEAGRMDQVDQRYQQLESLAGVTSDPRMSAVLAMANLKRGEFAEARLKFDLALHLAKQDSSGRSDATFMAQLRSGAAACAQEIGAFDEAERYLEDVADEPRAGGVDPRTAAVIRANLGRMYLTLERLDDAERELEGVLTEFRELQGARHPDTLMLLLDLANLAQMRGHGSEALQRCNEALEGLLAVRGQEHPLAAQARMQLASLYRDQGQCSDALEQAQQAMATLDARLGSSHKRSALACLRAALIAADCRSTAEGAVAFDQLQQEASRRFRELSSALGSENVEVLRALVYFADVSAKTPTALQGALTRYQEAEHGFRELYGDGGPTVASLRLRRGRLLEQMDRPHEALRIYERALRELDRGLSGHVVRSDLLASLGDVYHTKGEFDKAKECWGTSVRILADLYGRDHPRVTQFMSQRRR